MTPGTETNLQRTKRELGEGQARLRAEQMTDPQQAAMLKAGAPTKAELADLTEAEQAVRDAEAAVNAAGVALDRARRGMAPIEVPDPKRPFSFFHKRPETYRAAQEALPGLDRDLAEARMRLTNANRYLRQLTLKIYRDRQERRRVAKVAYAPPRAPAKLHGNPFAPKEAA
jgi:hypothetical protein